MKRQPLHAGSVQPSNIWEVEVDPQLTGYECCHLTTRYDEGQSVVIVDTEKFFTLVEQGEPSMVLPKIKSIDEVSDHYPSVRRLVDFMDTLSVNGIPEMPIVSLSDGYCVAKAGIFRNKIVFLSRLHICYTNGRHRSRFLQWAGAKSFPVQVPTSEADRIMALCGYTAPCSS